MQNCMERMAQGVGFFLYVLAKSADVFFEGD